MNDLLLPERTRLLHVGPPKTGTTALQSALAARRPELLRHGVRYPGTGVDHGTAIAAFTGERWGWGGAGSGVPARLHWTALLAEVTAERQRRVLLGHEYAARADEATIRAFDAVLGPRLRVVITLRDPAAMLPSIWQESLKLGATVSFDDFLRRNLERRGPGGRAHPSRNQGFLVERWARVLGRDRVLVVVAEAARPAALFTAFEGMLGLPDGLLGRGGDGRTGNRGLTFAEAEVLRLVNREVKRAGLRSDDYATLVAGAAVGRLLERTPPPAEPRPALPAWAAQALHDQAVGWVRAIEGSGVRIVGDAAALVPAPAGQDVEDDGRVPREVAVALLAGVVDALAGRGRAPRAPGLAAVHPAEHLVVRGVSVGTLLQVVVSRVLRRAGKAARLVPGLLRR